MEKRLATLVQTTNPRVIGQVINSKANADLLLWLHSVSRELIDVTITERVYYILNGKPEFTCHNGNKKPLIQKQNHMDFATI